MKKLITLTFAFILIAALAAVSYAQNAKPAAKPAPKAVKFLGKGDGVRV